MKKVTGIWRMWGKNTQGGLCDNESALSRPLPHSPNGTGDRIYSPMAPSYSFWAPLHMWHTSFSRRQSHPRNVKYGLTTFELL